MPTIRGIPGPYRFYFYNFDCMEPPHVHVERDNALCKFWLDRIGLAWNSGISPVELNRIRRVIFTESSRIAEAWREHCGRR